MRDTWRSSCEPFLSDLAPYNVTDFVYDNIQDQFNRTDGTTLIPRTAMLPATARDRFTKFDPSPPRPIRLDFTTPQPLEAEVQNRRERPTNKEPGPSSPETARQLSRTLHHYDVHWVGRHVYP